MKEERILTLNPDPRKVGTNIAKWKYDAVRRAILHVVPKKGEGVAFVDLPRLVKQALPREFLQGLGSVSWYTTTVKLDMEARGEIARVPGSRPQRLLRT